MKKTPVYGFPEEHWKELHRKGKRKNPAKKDSSAKTRVFTIQTTTHSHNSATYSGDVPVAIVLVYIKMLDWSHFM